MSIDYRIEDLVVYSQELWIGPITVSRIWYIKASTDLAIEMTFMGNITEMYNNILANSIRAKTLQERLNSQKKLDTFEFAAF